MKSGSHMYVIGSIYTLPPKAPIINWQLVLWGAQFLVSLALLFLYILVGVLFSVFLSAWQHLHKLLIMAVLFSVFMYIYMYVYTFVNICAKSTISIFFYKCNFANYVCIMSMGTSYAMLSKCSILNFIHCFALCVDLRPF